MLFLLLSCAPEEPKATGAELLDSYNSALCGVLTQSDCGVELANCGSPVVVFPDQDACMDARNNLSEGCEGLEAEFLLSQETVQSCTVLLDAAASSCAETDLCMDEQTVLEQGACAEVEEIFGQCG